MIEKRYSLRADTRGHLFVGVNVPDEASPANTVLISSHKTIDEAFDAKDALQADIDRINKRHCATCE